MTASDDAVDSNDTVPRERRFFDIVRCAETSGEDEAQDPIDIFPSA
jgi:hypothetical protein